ncbi:MAG: hypothetical protein ACE10D_05645 [Planctomycetota bacterium]
MKPASLSLILSSIALVGMGVMYLKLDELSERVGNERAGVRTERAPVARPIEEGDYVASVHSTPAPTPARIAELEERMAKVEKASAKSKPTFSWGLEDGDRKFRMPRFKRPYRSLKRFAKDLKLTNVQQDRIQAAIDRGRERIENIMKIPGEDGKSPHERREAALQELRERAKSGKHDAGAIMAIMPALTGYRNEKIPGMNATYGEEIDRVKQETREDVNGNLSAEQQEQFADTNIDGMLGGGGGTHMVSVFSAGDGVGGIGGLVIEVGKSVEIEEPEEIQEEEAEEGGG